MLKYRLQLKVSSGLWLLVLLNFSCNFKVLCVNIVSNMLPGKTSLYGKNYTTEFTVFSYCNLKINKEDSIKERRSKKEWNVYTSYQI